MTTPAPPPEAMTDDNRRAYIATGARLAQDSARDYIRNAEANIVNATAQLVANMIDADAIVTTTPSPDGDGVLITARHTDGDLTSRLLSFTTTPPEA